MPQNLLSKPYGKIDREDLNTHNITSFTNNNHPPQLPHSLHLISPPTTSSSSSESKNHVSILFTQISPTSSSNLSYQKERKEKQERNQGGKEKMSLTIPTNLSKPMLKPRFGVVSPLKSRSMVVCSAAPSNQESHSSTESQLKAFSAALALSSILLSAPLPAVADIAGLTPCKDSKQFAKREKQSIKKLESSLKLYAPDSAPALAINATIEKTKRRFDNYGKQGLLCGSDGLPHLIVSGDQRHWGEFITPGILFLYIAGWIGWVGRSYLIAIRDEKKPTMKEIIIDVPLAASLIFRGFSWPVAAYRELVNGNLVAKDV